MGTLPSPSQVARNHTPLYEAFYQQVDPAGAGCVTAVDAAAFLKRSGLSDGILSKIWDMSDPVGKGFLDKRGFFVALKLIALAQSGKDLSMANISLEVPPPQMKSNGRISPAVDWTVKVAEYKKYEEMFNSLVPVDNRLPGNKVKPLMLNSKLPLEILGKIWDLSDTDQDGFLTKEEFILAMHLTYKALENIPVPSVLPPELIAVLKKNSPLGAVKVLPDVLPAGMDGTLTAYTRRSSTPSVDPTSKTAAWVINAIDKAKYDEIFHTLDTDVDGFVTGPDIRETLLQSGLSQAILAHVWNLCDIKQNGKLNSEQFALAMYLIQQKLQGCEIPTILFPEMIPPTLRPKPSSEIIQDGATLVISGESDSSGSKELDLISNEIKDLQMEKMSLEKDIAQKEADVKIKNGELKNLQNELDALETMLKQLEIQKGEARKRLNDLDTQKISVDNMFADVNARTEEEAYQVESIKKQVDEQQFTLETQEQELNAKRQELSDLRQEEGRLEMQISTGRSQLETLTKSLQDTQLQISQMKLKIDQAQEQHRLMTDAIQQLDAALASGEFGTISEFTLTAITPISEVELEHFSPNGINGNVTNDLSAPLPVDEFQDDPFKSKDPFNNRVNGFSSDPFADDPFKSDPFKEKDIIESDDPFTRDPFEEVFGVNQSDSKEDPFQGSDPFGSFPAPAGSTATNDPFDPFGLTSGVSESPIKVPPNADPFGADPFGPNPTAPPRPESPTPALPPKKSKAPPPRPAPPKVSSGPVKTGPTRAAPAPPIPAAPAIPTAAPAPPVPTTAAATTTMNDPFANAAEAITVTSSQAFPDIFSVTTVKSDDSFDPFSSSAGVQQADFANFADFDNAK